MILYISQLIQLSRSESRARNELIMRVKLDKLSVYVPLMLVYYRRSCYKNADITPVAGIMKRNGFDTHCRNALHWYQMTIKTSKFTSPLTVCSVIYTKWHQMKHKGSASPALWMIPQWPVDFPHRSPGNWKEFPCQKRYDDKDYWAREVYDK